MTKLHLDHSTNNIELLRKSKMLTKRKKTHEKNLHKFLQIKSNEMDGQKFILRVYLLKLKYKIWLKISMYSADLYPGANSRLVIDVFSPGCLHWRQAEEPNNAIKFTIL